MLNEPDASRLLNPLARRFHSQLSERPARAISNRDAYCLGSTVGSVRQRNEDIGAVLSVRYANGLRDFDVAVVCDGLGGMLDGREAALIAASTFLAACAQAGTHVPPPSRLQNAITTAHREVQQRLNGRGGTTLSAALVARDGNAWFVHVGDTRVFTIGGNSAKLVSRSDTMGAILNRDVGSPDAARLIQYVGVDDEIEPQIAKLDIAAGGGVLITSDGAHSVPNSVWDAVVFNAKNGNDLVRKLLNLADALGGLDNATALYIPLLASDGQSDVEGGASMISLFTLSGECEIWMIHDSPAAERAVVRQVIPSEQPQRLARESFPISKKKSMSKKKISAKSKQDAGMLPLDDPAEIGKLDFPNEVED